MASWQDLDDELQRWRDGGAPATLWWRDDDCVAPTPALERMLALSAAAGLPLALAVVPARTSEALAARLEGTDTIVLPHGLTHENRAPAGERKAEFGPHRPVHEMLADVAIGWERLRGLFGARALPVFVPPWNRIAEALLSRLGHAGMRGVSGLGPRTAARPGWMLTQVNVHVDPIDWQARGFRGEAAVLERLVGHLAARRREEVDRAEPTGLMTHHLVQDEAAWGFLARLFEACAGRARWLGAAELLAAEPAAA